MLLPIVLLLASAGTVQQADNIATANTQQSAPSTQPHTLLTNPGPNRFVNPGPRGEPRFDKGIIAGRNPCLADGTCQAVCAHITAYVFSDGENPQLEYVTDCPNLDVPNRTERARHNLPKNQQQPDLKRTKN